MWSLEKQQGQYAVVRDKQIILLLGESHGENSEEHRFWQEYCRKKNYEERVSEPKH